MERNRYEEMRAEDFDYEELLRTIKEKEKEAYIK